MWKNRKAKLQELFNGITQSQQKVNRITEMDNKWCISFENTQLGDLDIVSRKSADIAQEIKGYVKGVNYGK